MSEANQCHPMKSHRGPAVMRHRGVALVTALLVVALASLAATALLSTANLAIHRTAALRDSEAAWWVARGVEGWVIGILKRDRQQPQQYDGLDEPWAQPVDLLPIEQGFIRGRLYDAQGFFNLNNLLVPPNDPGYAKYEAHFKSILASLPGQLTIPPGLVGAIRDWGDADQNLSMPDGGEDGTYQGLDPAYRTADQLFTAVSELRAVNGMTPELYDALSPLLTALPVKTGTALNVNTAPPEVLYAMPDADRTEVESFLGRRDKQPAQSLAEVPNSLKLARSPPVDVKTSWFEIRNTDVFVGSSRVGLYSLINRAGATPIVIAHSAETDTARPQQP